MAGPSDASARVETIIRRLGLSPHPEGGYFRETWRDASTNGRGSGTAIYYLLKAGEVSRWHRVDAVEIWHFYAGDPLQLRLADGIGKPTTHVLGRNIERGYLPQIIVPKNTWQSARIATPEVGWVLVGCTVSPAFEFSGFELARDGWEP